MFVRKQAPPNDDVKIEPKYRLLLRPIGAFLDSINASQVVLCEIEQGFIWRCVERNNPDFVRSGLISHDEIPELSESMKQSRLGKVEDTADSPPEMGVCAWGYEELLRCLSDKLDLEAATTVLFIEDDTSVLVQFSLAVPLYVQMEPERMVPSNYFHEDLYTREDIEALIKRLRGHRGSRYYR
jgi:hypothetical protein